MIRKIADYYNKNKYLLFPTTLILLLFLISHLIVYSFTDFGMEILYFNEDKVNLISNMNKFTKNVIFYRMFIYFLIPPICFFIYNFISDKCDIIYDGKIKIKTFFEVEYTIFVIITFIYIFLARDIIGGQTILNQSDAYYSIVGLILTQNSNLVKKN